MTESPPASALGKYEIVGRLARGQTTDLLLARTRGMAGFERYVALKCVRPERAGDAVFVHAFVQEARLAAALHHHNIVQVQDIGDEGGLPFFAMEYIQGEDLRSILGKLHDKKQQLPLQQLVTIGTAVAAALHHAHEQRGPDGKSLGIIHRDVSPGNIIVGYDGNVKVVDFSMAKATITTVTSVGVVRGKAGYMAPEQCGGERLDRRSDVFALGIVLYEMATLERLFKGNSDHETMSTIVLGTIPRPRTVKPDIPQRLEEIIMKALARLPGDRYQTAAELGAALEKFAVEAGVTASTTSLAAFIKEHFGEPREPGDGVIARDARKDFDGSGVGLAAPAGAQPRPTYTRKHTTEVDDKDEFHAEPETTRGPSAASLGATPLSPSSIAGKLARPTGGEGPTVKLDRADLEKALAHKAKLAEADNDQAKVDEIAAKLDSSEVARPTPTPKPAPKKDLTPLPKKDAAPGAKKDLTPLPKRPAKDDAKETTPMARDAIIDAAAAVDPRAETPIVDDEPTTHDDVPTAKAPKPVKVVPKPGTTKGPAPDKSAEAVAPTAPAMVAVEPPSDAKVEGIARGDMTELVAPLPPPKAAKAERAATAVPKAMALVQKYRWWVVGAAGALVLFGIIFVIATSGASDLQAAPQEEPKKAEPVAEPTPPPPPPKEEPPPAPPPVAKEEPPPPPPAKEEPPPPPPPVAKKEPPPPPPKEEPKPKQPKTKTVTAATHPKTTTPKKTTSPPKQPPKKKGLEYDPNSLFLGGK